MKTKMIEIRDRLTCIPALAIQMTPFGPVEKQFLRRCGYPMPDGRADGDVLPSVVLMNLSDQKASSDAYDWGDRTMNAAHLYIERHFDDLRDGQVVDVRVLLGEASEPVDPEIWR